MTLANPLMGTDSTRGFSHGNEYPAIAPPFRGMNDQEYDQVIRPATINAAWIEKYNTRWAGPMVLGKNQP